MAEHGETEAFMLAPVLAIDPCLQSRSSPEGSCTIPRSRAEQAALPEISFGSDKPHSRAAFAISWRFIHVISAAAAAGIGSLSLAHRAAQAPPRRSSGSLRGKAMRRRRSRSFRILIARPIVRRRLADLWASASEASARRDSSRTCRLLRQARQFSAGLFLRRKFVEARRTVARLRANRGFPGRVGAPRQIGFRPPPAVFPRSPGRRIIRDILRCARVVGATVSRSLAGEIELSETKRRCGQRDLIFGHVRFERATRCAPGNRFARPASLRRLCHDAACRDIILVELEDTTGYEHGALVICRAQGIPAPVWRGAFRAARRSHDSSRTKRQQGNERQPRRRTQRIRNSRRASARDVPETIATFGAGIVAENKKCCANAGKRRRPRRDSSRAPA